MPQKSAGFASIFFIAALLPLLFVFATLVFDVQNLYRNQRRARDLVANAALIGAKQLPFVSAAQSSARGYIEQLAPQRLQIELRSTSQDISVFAKGYSRLSFAKYFALQRLAPNLQTGLPYKVTARAKINARDLLIFVDNSGYLAPDLEGPQAVPFGYSQWPAARLFRSGALFARSQSGQRLEARLATQQCFNPAFSAIKEAAIRLYDYAISYTAHSVGITMGPGANEPISVVREVGPRAQVNATANNGTGIPMAVFGYYRRPWASDENCLAIAERERSHNGYRFPPIARELTPLQPSVRPAILTQPRHFTLPLHLSHYLTPREVIWSRAAQNNKRVNFLDVLDSISNQLLGAPWRKERGILNQNISASAVLFMGDIPWIESRRMIAPGNGPIDSTAAKKLYKKFRQIDQTAGARDHRINLYFVLPRHEGIYRHLDKNGADQGCRFPSDKMVHLPNCPAFFNETYVFEEFLSDLNLDYINTTFFRAADTASLAQDLIAILPLIDRSVVLIN